MPTTLRRPFKHILFAPVWLLAGVYDGRNFQVVINGYTEAIAGTLPEELDQTLARGVCCNPH